MAEKENTLMESESEGMEMDAKNGVNNSPGKTSPMESDDIFEPEESPAADEVDPVFVLEEKLKATEASLSEATDRMLRMAADFDNYKKRMAREADEFRKFANESLIKQLLNILDNLERAIDSSKSGEKASGSILEGVELIYKEILSILEKYCVLPVDCLEKSFDPLFHQAVSQEETEKYPENTVVRELMKGYTMHDRLIRPSMVTVSKTKTTEKKNEKTINETA